MSHIVTIQTEVRDAVAVEAACSRLSLPAPRAGTFRLFTDEATGLAVELPGWRYPAVCELTSGSVRCDTYNGRWGDPAQLGRFLQGYAVEKAKLEARRRGHPVAEHQLPNGSVRLTVRVGGTA